MAKASQAQKTRGIMTRKRAAERMDLIRRENVKRHTELAARRDLQMRHIAAQRVATMQMEHDRLLAASVHGSGLDAARHNRMAALKQVLLSFQNADRVTQKTHI